MKVLTNSMDIINNDHHLATIIAKSAPDSEVLDKLYSQYLNIGALIYIFII